MSSKMVVIQKRESKPTKIIGLINYEKDVFGLHQSYYKIKDKGMDILPYETMDVVSRNIVRLVNQAGCPLTCRITQRLLDKMCVFNKTYYF